MPSNMPHVIMLHGHRTKWLIYAYLQTFPANTDTTTLVENQLPTPITAQCLRFHPLTWHEWPDVKIEVYGCLAI